MTTYTHFYYVTATFLIQDETEKKAAEKKFMDIAAAKEVLTDDGKIEDHIHIKNER